jgi:hypothetical protein
MHTSMGVPIWDCHSLALAIGIAVRESVRLPATIRICTCNIFVCAGHRKASATLAVIAPARDAQPPFPPVVYTFEP